MTPVGEHASMTALPDAQKGPADPCPECGRPAPVGHLCTVFDVQCHKAAKARAYPGVTIRAAVMNAAAVQRATEAVVEAALGFEDAIADFGYSRGAGADNSLLVSMCSHMSSETAYRKLHALSDACTRLRTLREAPDAA